MVLGVRAQCSCAGLREDGPLTVDPTRVVGESTHPGRVTMSAILGQLAAERTVDEVLADYPYLEHDDLLDRGAGIRQRLDPARGPLRGGVRLLVDANLSRCRPTCRFRAVSTACWSQMGQ